MVTTPLDCANAPAAKKQNIQEIAILMNRTLKKNAEFFFTKLGILYVYYKLQTRTMAIFVFLTASARAGFVSSDRHVLTDRLLGNLFTGIFHFGHTSR
jgi:hypothetical protein